MEIKNFVRIRLKGLVDIAFNNFGLENCPLEVDRITEIHFAVIDEIVGAYKIFDGLLHCLDIEMIAGEEIFVGSASAPIPCIEIVGYF